MTGHAQCRRIARHRRQEVLSAPTVQQLAAELAEAEAEIARLTAELTIATRMAPAAASAEVSAHD